MKPTSSTYKEEKNIILQKINYIVKRNYVLPLLSTMEKHLVIRIQRRFFLQIINWGRSFFWLIILLISSSMTHYRCKVYICEASLILVYNPHKVR